MKNCSDNFDETNITKIMELHGVDTERKDDEKEEDEEG